MNENLIIKSYWEICGLNEDEINFRLLEPSVSHHNNKYIPEICLETNKESIYKNNHGNEKLNRVSESKKIDREEHDERINPNRGCTIDTTFQNSTLLPSHLVKLDKISIFEREELDNLYMTYFEAGFEKGRSNDDKKNEIDNQSTFHPEMRHKELFQAWCSAGYKTGLVFGLLKQRETIRNENQRNGCMK